MDKKLSKDWQIKKLGEVCKTTYGKGLSTKELKKSGFPVFGANGIIGFNDKYLYKESQVLISCRGAYSGKINLSPPLCYVTNNSLILEIFNEEEMNKKFLFYILHTVNKTKLVTGTAQPQVTINNAVELTFSIPKIETQQAIVSKIEELFSELDKGIEDLKTAQQQLKTYRQSVLKWAFEGKLTNEKVKDGVLPKGWEILNIGKICKCIVPNRDKPKSFSGDIKWVTTPNLKPNSIKLEYENIGLGLSESEVIEYNARVIPIGGVIMTCVGNFGLAAIVEKPIVINQQLHAFISNDVIIPKYIAYNIQFNKHYFEKKSTSTTIQYVNKENCNSMPIPFCCVKEQDQIVQEIERRLSVADKMEESIVQSLLQAEALRQSILKKAFSGELV